MEGGLVNQDTTHVPNLLKVPTHKVETADKLLRDFFNLKKKNKKSSEEILLENPNSRDAFYVKLKGGMSKNV